MQLLQRNCNQLACTQQKISPRQADYYTDRDNCVPNPTSRHTASGYKQHHSE